MSPPVVLTFTAQGTDLPDCDAAADLVAKQFFAGRPFYLVNDGGDVDMEARAADGGYALVYTFECSYRAIEIQGGDT